MIIHCRRIELQSFTDRICRHPVLAGSEVQPIFFNKKNLLSIFIQCWFKANDCPCHCPGVETFCVRDRRQEVDKGGQRSFLSSWLCREICVTLFMNSNNCFKTRIRIYICRGRGVQRVILLLGQFSSQQFRYYQIPSFFWDSLFATEADSLFLFFSGSKHPCQHRTCNWWKYWRVFQGGISWMKSTFTKNLSNTLQLAKLESAVKTMHSVANDQAAKYRGEMKKVPFEILD